MALATVATGRFNRRDADDLPGSACVPRGHDLVLSPARGPSVEGSATGVVAALRHGSRRA
jgi:hypothetical protein